MTSQGVANLDPRGMVGFYYESMGANDIPGSGQFGPKGMVGRVYIGEPH